MIERGVVEALHRAQASKDPKAIAQAEALASVLKAVKLDGFQDVPLAQAETLIAVQRFSQEAREALDEEKYVIYELTGQSIRTLREADRPFWSTWHKDYPDFEQLASRRSEVAINPNELFLPDSNNKTLAQQEKIVRDFSKKLTRKVKGVEAIVGEAPDYVESVFAHLDATGVRLFGKDYDFRYTRTKTPTVDSYVANVGGFDADDGLSVRDWDRDDGISHVWVSPLVVPASNA